MHVTTKKTIGVVLTMVVVSIVCVAAFQNCSGFGAAGGQSASANVSAQSSQQAALASIQSSVNVTMNLSNPTTTQLQNAITTLQQLLTQVQAIPVNGLTPAQQNLAAQLVALLQTDIAQLQADVKVLPAPPPPPAPCTFDGQSIPSGGSVTAYQFQKAPSGTTCETTSQVRVCTNGVLSGSNTFAFCIEQGGADVVGNTGPGSCEIPLLTCPEGTRGGFSVPNGTSLAYQCGPVCPRQVCTNGIFVLSGTCGIDGPCNSFPTPIGNLQIGTTSFFQCGAAL